MSWSERARTCGAYSRAFVADAVAADGLEQAMWRDGERGQSARLYQRERTLVALRKDAELWGKLSEGFATLANKLETF